MSEEYDLKKSEGKVGAIYPVILSKNGKVIDGYHRLEADPKWPTLTLDQIDNEEKFLIARPIANWHRRVIPRVEKEKWINDLAEYYQKQGLKVMGETSAHKNEIRDKIAEVTGLHKDTINEYLDSRFKQKPYEASTKAVSEPRVSASQRIETQLGPEYVERHREEVREELLDEIRSDAIETAKKELREDPDFIVEAIEKAPEIIPTLPKKTIERAKKVVTKEMGVKEGTIYTVGEYECPHCKKHYIIKCNGKKDWVE